MKQIFQGYDLKAQSWIPESGVNQINFDGNLTTPKLRTNFKNPGGNWATDEKTSEIKTETCKTNSPELANPFSFIKKSKKNEDPLKLLTLDQLRSDKYGFEKKIVNEIVQPYGATKKPTDSLLSTFREKCKNLEPIVILSALIVTIKDKEEIWISQLRALYAIESLLKVDTYFAVLKHNCEEFESISFTDIQSSAGIENMMRIKKSILDKIKSAFVAHQIKPIEVDLSKLESMKEKNSLKFFEKMEIVKQKKKGADVELNFVDNVKPSTAGYNLMDFADMETSPCKMNKNTTVHDQSNLLDVELVPDKDDKSGLIAQNAVKNVKPHIDVPDVDLFGDFATLRVGEKSNSPELIDFI